MAFANAKTQLDQGANGRQVSEVEADVTAASETIKGAMEALRALTKHAIEVKLAFQVAGGNRALRVAGGGFSPDLSMTLQPMSFPETDVPHVRQRVALVDRFVLMVRLRVVVMTAMLVLHVGKAFGTPLDLVTAFLWGIGVDQAIKGVGALLTRLGVPGVPGLSMPAGKAQ